MNDYEKEKLLAWAANIVNRSEPSSFVRQGFLSARSISDEEFNRSNGTDYMYDLLRRARDYSVTSVIAYWYGRITDPRWNKTEVQAG